MPAAACRDGAPSAVLEAGGCDPASIAASLAARLAQLLADLAPHARPAVLARLERTAAERYDAWAEATPSATEAALLRTCAERERTIAMRVEEQFPVAAAEAAGHASLLPDAARTYAAAFEGLSRTEAFAVQATLERAGASAWRGLAAGESDPHRRATLLECATLEEASADALRTIAPAHVA